MSAPIDLDRLAEWRRLCEFLSSQKYHASYYETVPPTLRHLLVTARRVSKDGLGLWDTPETRAMQAERGRLRLVYWAGGYGWRLHKDWRERIEKAYQEAERC